MLLHAGRAMCGLSQTRVFSMMQRKITNSHVIECLRDNFIYDSYLIRDETAFSDHTLDGKLFVALVSFRNIIFLMDRIPPNRELAYCTRRHLLRRDNCFPTLMRS